MKRIRIHASAEYDVLIGSGLLSGLPAYVRSLGDVSDVCVVSDDLVYPLYGESSARVLREAGLRTVSFVFPHGESHKTLETYQSLVEYLADVAFPRSGLLVAVGGGVTGDLTGFAAATFRRGVRFLQIPTSLLAAVDASVGGKTALDLPAAKNQIGCFYHPCLVLCDTATFSTLPETEYRNGCAEIIKYAMLDDPAFCTSLLRRPVRDRYPSVVAKCVEKKRFYVEQDELDGSIRNMLNFGHTFGHAIEACSGYRIPHGKAVAAGMAIITRAAAGFRICSPETPAFLERLLNAYGLPDGTDFTADELAKEAVRDKKADGENIRLIVPEAVGRCSVRTVPVAGLKDWLRAGGCK